MPSTKSDYTCQTSRGVATLSYVGSFVYSVCASVGVGASRMSATPPNFYRTAIGDDARNETQLAAPSKVAPGETLIYVLRLTNSTGRPLAVAEYCSPFLQLLVLSGAGRAIAEPTGRRLPCDGLSPLSSRETVLFEINFPIAADVPDLDAARRSPLCFSCDLGARRNTEATGHTSAAGIPR